MAQKKKLQVFVSSTYTDLHEERQAAVQAILTAGHIPAGMELFAAGDETQMNVIKRWIDESDIYMLILGGRYGSIEPTSQKSYIHLEYEYALEKAKPLFAVVINEEHLEAKIKQHGSKVFEKEHPDKLKKFREFVCSKMVRFWSDPREIKLAIMETMADFANRSDVVGWIPGNETVNTGAVAEEIARLAKENSELRQKIDNFEASATTYNGLTFTEMYSFLIAGNISGSTGETNFQRDLSGTVKKLSEIFKDHRPGLIHVLWLIRFFIQAPIRALNSNNEIMNWLNWVLQVLNQCGITTLDNGIYTLTETGKQFLVRLTFHVVKNELYLAHNYYFQWNMQTNEYRFTL